MCVLNRVGDWGYLLLNCRQIGSGVQKPKLQAVAKQPRALVSELGHIPDSARQVLGRGLHGQSRVHEGLARARLRLLASLEIPTVESKSSWLDKAQIPSRCVLP